MSTTKLFWQRERPLADFSTATGSSSDLIFVTTRKGALHVVDDIFDDCRNDVLNLLALLSDDNGRIHFSSLEKNGIELKETHSSFRGALDSAKNEVMSKSGSVVIIDSTDLIIDNDSREELVALMESPEIHVVMIVAVEGIEAMQHYLENDPYIVIDVDEKSELLSL